MYDLASTHSMKFLPLGVSQSKQKMLVAWAQGNCCLHCWTTTSAEENGNVPSFIHIIFSHTRSFLDSLPKVIATVKLRLSESLNIIGNFWDNAEMLHILSLQYLTNRVTKRQEDANVHKLWRWYKPVLRENRSWIHRKKQKNKKVADRFKKRRGKAEFKSQAWEWER